VSKRVRLGGNITGAHGDRGERWGNKSFPLEVYEKKKKAIGRLGAGSGPQNQEFKVGQKPILQISWQSLRKWTQQKLNKGRILRSPRGKNIKKGSKKDCPSEEGGRSEGSKGLAIGRGKVFGANAGLADPYGRQMLRRVWWSRRDQSAKRAIEKKRQFTRCIPKKDKHKDFPALCGAEQNPIRHFE